MKTTVMIGLMLLIAGPVGATQAVAQSAPPTAKVAKPDVSIVARVDERITQMHRRLQITPEQEPAWTAFAQVMRDNATRGEAAYRQHAAGVGTMSAVDNLRMFAQIEQQRAQGVQTLLASFETLYAGFSDEQKQTADRIFRREQERMANHKHNKK